ncbi:hypothetical protein ACSBO6_09785 [Bacillus sp. AL-1R]
MLTYYLSISGINKLGESTEIATDSAFARKVYSASLVSSKIPESMDIDSHQTVSITVKNDGLESWTKEKGYRLASSEKDYFTGTDEFQLDTGDHIKTNESKTFGLPFYSGKTETTKTTKWHMVRNSDKISINVEQAVAVKKTDNDASTTTQNAETPSVSPLTVAPTGYFTINNGASFTNSRDIHIETTITNGYSGTIYESVSFDGINYEPYVGLSSEGLTWRTPP